MGKEKPHRYGADVVFLCLLALLGLLGCLGLCLGLLSLLGLGLGGLGGGLVGGHRPLGNFDPDLIGAGLDDQVVFLHVDNGANNAADGGDLVAGLHGRTHLLCFLLPLVFGADEHEVEHGQHEHQSLLYPDRQIAILDAFAGTEAATAKGEVRALYQEWKNVRKELSAYELDEEARKREAAFLTFEINEIDQAELKEGEDEALETAYRKMGHAKKIAESLQTVYAITGYGAENSAGEQVGRAIRELQQAAVYDDALSGPSQTLSDIDGLLNDFNREISAYLSELTFSEEEYYETEKRLDEINRLKAKYGKTMEEITAYREEQQKKLEKLENFESCRAALQEQLQKTEQKLDAAAHNLSKIRRNYAKRLETQIIEGLRDLNFLHVAFEISFEKTKSYTENGTDAVEFLISTNPGEAIRPLAKVVSGGELSRIMLAIKTILADRDETETLIFDEIDTGISGRTAQKVSEKMAQIGQRHQVICITHLPQIAAMADSHFEIEKNVEENETVTSIHPLSEEDSVRELARMLGGAKITDSVLANASEMKELAQVQKSARLK